MFFAKTGTVSRKSGKDQYRVASRSSVGDIYLKIVFNTDNDTGIGWDAWLSEYTIYTRANSLQKHDKVVVDWITYIVSDFGRQSGSLLEYYIYQANRSNESSS